MKPPRVLVIAGSDSGGGAGIQADIKTITMLGGFAMTAITAITAQNTLGVQAIYPLPPEAVTKQIQSVMEDIGADMIKIGMLGNAVIIKAVAEAIEKYAAKVRVVLDPVIQAKGGASLLQDDALDALKQHLLPLAMLVTPNIPEAEMLAGRHIATVDDMKTAAMEIATKTKSSVLVKGGHLENAMLSNILYAQGSCETFTTKRIDSVHTHGTGCTLASAIAVLLAKGFSLIQAVTQAQTYVHGAILHAPAYGRGHGPMNHGWVIPAQL